MHKPLRSFFAIGVALTALLSAACSYQEPENESSDEPIEERIYEIDGGWHGEIDIRIQGDQATLISFRLKSVTGRQHFDVGGTYIRNIRRVSGSSWKGEIARFQRVKSPSEPDGRGPIHIVGVEYAEIDITFRGLLLSLSENNELGTRFTSGGVSSELVYGGACENKYVNIQGYTLYSCHDDGSEESCLSPGEKKFWENTTCRQLGYSHEYKSARFQHDEGNNWIPGEHGAWGDDTGGSRAGFKDGSGGTPPPDAAPVGTQTGTEPSTTEPGAGNCLSGVWKTDMCGGTKKGSMSFNGNSGEVRIPDCNGVCDDIIYKYDYTVSGESVTLKYNGSSPVNCPSLGVTQTPDPPKTNDTFEFTCGNGTLTTKTSRGTASYTR